MRRRQFHRNVGQGYPPGEGDRQVGASTLVSCSWGESPTSAPVTRLDYSRSHGRTTLGITSCPPHVRLPVAVGSSPTLRKRWRYYESGQMEEVDRNANGSSNRQSGRGSHRRSLTAATNVLLDRRREKAVEGKERRAEAAELRQASRLLLSETYIRARGRPDRDGNRTVATTVRRWKRKLLRRFNLAAQ